MPRVGAVFVAVCITLSSRPAAAEMVDIPGPNGVALQAELVRPAGPAVAPAIVALHGCGGPFRARDRQWADLLAGQGHIILFPNSFSSRGMGSQCNVQFDLRRNVTPEGLRRLDAIAAGQWLQAQPGTPPGGLLLLGWSDGGSTALAAGRVAADLPAGLWRGIVAFYPGCTVSSRNEDWRPQAQLLILMGESDNWTKAAPCHALAKHVGDGMTLITYPETFHDFDAPGIVLHSRDSNRGMVTVGTNEAARADALARVLAFMGQLPQVR